MPVILQIEGILEPYNDLAGELVWPNKAFLYRRLFA